MSTYLVTGGAGFIGSNITEFLLERGEKVRVLDNLSTGKRENIAHLNGVELLEGDICDLEVTKEAMKGADFCLHQAALPSVARSVEDPARTNEVNVGGTLNVLVAAVETSVKRLVYASSSSVYGDTPTLPKSEESPPNPLSPYAVSKFAGELYVSSFGHVHGLETVVLRYFNVFGPRQDPTSKYAAVIPAFITAMSEKRKPTIFGDGGQSRDFTYVGNVVEANVAACHAPVSATGAAYNVGCGSRTTVNELARQIAEILKSDLEPVHVAPRPGDVRHSCADISAARRELGYEPQIEIKEGLAKTVEWLTSEHL
jgi:nucleoside-diphosphate-sugar epimerase